MSDKNGGAEPLDLDDMADGVDVEITEESLGDEIIIDENDGAEPEPKKKKEADDGADEGRDDDGDQDDKRGGKDDDDGEENATAFAIRKRLEKKYAAQLAEAQAVAEEERTARLAAEERASTFLESGVSVTVDGLQEKKKGVLAKLKVAKEEGNTDDELTLLDELSNINLDLKTAENTKKRLSERAPKKDDDQEEKRRQPQRKAGPPKRFENWLDRNEWMSEPDKYRAEINGMSAIEDELKSEGFDPNDADFYAELDKRGAERFSRIAKYQKESRAYRGRSTAGAGDAGGGNSGRIEGLIKKPNGKYVYRLNRDDIKAMENWGLDPTSKLDREVFTGERIKTLREQAAAKRR